MQHDSSTGRVVNRRAFVTALSATGAGLWLPAFAAERSEGGSAGRSPRDDGGGDEDEVTPTEDLMREHGVLKRVLLVYHEGIRRIDAKQDLPPDAVHDAAAIIRTFIEDYHERLEEEHLFPRFETARTLTDLVQVLRAQHRAGRRLTDRIMQLATPQTIKSPDSARQLRDYLHQFTRMYEPHEAREDTVLFPALRRIVSKQEYGALGEDFEKKEHQLFGEEGFERFVDRVAAIEKRLGIYDLGQFTPAV